MTNSSLGGKKQTKIQTKPTTTTTKPQVEVDPEVPITDPNDDEQKYAAMGQRQKQKVQDLINFSFRKRSTNRGLIRRKFDLKKVIETC